MPQPTSVSLPSLPEQRFELIEPLGEGGMASVYRALDHEAGEWVAVKVLLDKHVSRPAIRQRFSSEAEAMLKIRHRNVASVLYVNDTAIPPYFVMELAHGGCVVDWLQTHGAMPPKMAVDIAIQVCKGLGASHREGVIHRDVKPHNILVNHRGVCKITDFGVAALDDDSASLTRTGSVLGTLGYIAPEQRENAKAADARADVYSVAATLYTMLTARISMDLFMADQEPDLLDGVHEALIPILVKATNYRREDRHQSMRELAKQLYHAKALLPDDPPDTPSLVMNSLEELTDELVRMTTQDSNDHLRIPSDLGTISAQGRPVPPPAKPRPTGPPIQRTRLLRGEQTETRSGRTEARIGVLQAALFATVPVAALAVAVLGAALSGRNHVNAAVDQVVRQETELAGVLDAESELTVELTSLGAAAADVDGAWDRARGESAQVDPERVDELLLAYRRLLAEHQPHPGSTRAHLALKASGRLDRIDKIVTRTQRAERALTAASETPTGRLATLLGLTREP